MSFQKISSLVASKNAKLVVVAKNREISEIQKIIDAGAQFLAFNRVSEAAQKFPELHHFHGKKILIGHLQTNKAKKAVEIFDEIHSVDSLRIAEKINEEAQKRAKKMPILIQINVDCDAGKFGFSPEEFEREALSFLNFSFLEIRGVMTIGKQGGDSHHTFSSLFEIFQKTKKRNIFDQSFCEISMGMSNDFEKALECGATLVRVGSLLFVS